MKGADMRSDLIAPCGMNCALCISYQFRDKDINKKGFHRTYCPGCIPRGKHCLHMADSCEKLATGGVRFCSECTDYPCKRLRALDKRYRTKYHMSMIENLNTIAQHGVDRFLDQQRRDWSCPECGDAICCHNGLCLNCQLDTFLDNPKYRWDES